MSFWEWKKSRKPLQSLEQLKTNKNMRVVLMGVDFGQLIETLKIELNSANRESHLIAFASYFLAGLTALASMALSLGC